MLELQWIDFKPQEYNVGLPIFSDLASEDPDITMHQLKSRDNNPFKDSYLHPIHACFAMIASNEAIGRKTMTDVSDTERDRPKERQTIRKKQRKRDREKDWKTYNKN